MVDARHHMLGRLASILAKELLNGQRVVSFLPSFFLLPFLSIGAEKLPTSRADGYGSDEVFRR